MAEKTPDGNDTLRQENKAVSLPPGKTWTGVARYSGQWPTKPYTMTDRLIMRDRLTGRGTLEPPISQVPAKNP